LCRSKEVAHALSNKSRVHTPDGTHIEVFTDTHNHDAQITGQDAGPGMPPELERKVFDRFAQGGGGNGSGLGLAIVRALTEATVGR
jgi:two-component system, OmpR family, sensor kinase